MYLYPVGDEGIVVGDWVGKFDGETDGEALGNLNIPLMHRWISSIGNNIGINAK